jgi:uncharacterized protein (TIGR03435 family)
MAGICSSVKSIHKSTMKCMPNTRSLVVLVILAGAVAVCAQTPTKFPPVVNRESRVRSQYSPSYEVHISPSSPEDTGTSSDSAPDYWVTRGFELQETIGQLYNVPDSRVVLPAALDHKRYDVALLLPQAEDREAIRRRVRQAIKKKFGLILTFETRPLDVYVLSAVRGKAALKESKETAGIHVAMGGATIMVRDDQPSEKNLVGVDLSGMTMEEFAHVLETGLDRLVVDETGLKGRYELKTQPEASSTGEFFKMLRDQCGLDLKPARREVRVLVARSK